MRAVFLVLAASGVMLCACGDLPAPERPDPGEFATPVTDDNSDDREGLSGGVAPARPILNNVPTRTGQLTVAVRGQTDPRAAVVASNDGVTSFAEAGSGGSFCIDVGLRSGQTQQLEIWAQNSDGLVSPITTVTVTHDPLMTDEPIVEPDPSQGTIVEAVSEDTTLVYSSRTVNGSLNDVIDDDIATVLVTGPGQLSLDLQTVNDVTAIEIEFRDEFGSGSSQYATDYTVLVSGQDSASVPFSWVPVPEAALFGTRDGGVDRWELEPSIDARWIAFELVENAANDFFGEPIAVADIRVSARMAPGDQLPNPASPTCAP
ncbi:MAG: discoidin domain-containing protein [Myxococcota bacterium]